VCGRFKRQAVLADAGWPCYRDNADSPIVHRSLYFCYVSGPPDQTGYVPGDARCIVILPGALPSGKSVSRKEGCAQVGGIVESGSEFSRSSDSDLQRMIESFANGSR
jgi:hypothetical protein